VVVCKRATWMAREAPVVACGPGTCGADSTPHRLAAEIAPHRRYDNPLRTSSYTEAHCDYLQPFAEIGVPGGVAIWGAVACLFVGLGRACRRRGAIFRNEAILLMSVLGAGAAAAL